MQTLNTSGSIQRPKMINSSIKKIQMYLQKNHKLSRIDTMLYLFLKELYQVLLGDTDGDVLERLYSKYINLINISFGINGEEPNPSNIEELYQRSKFILDRELSSPASFMILNNHRHYVLLIKAIIEIKKLSGPDYFGYADPVEFKETLDKLRICDHKEKK